MNHRTYECPHLEYTLYCPYSSAAWRCQFILQTTFGSPICRSIRADRFSYGVKDGSVRVVVPSAVQNDQT